MPKLDPCSNFHLHSIFNHFNDENKHEILHDFFPMQVYCTLKFMGKTDFSIKSCTEHTFIIQLKWHNIIGWNASYRCDLHVDFYIYIDLLLMVYKNLTGWSSPWKAWLLMINRCFMSNLLTGRRAHCILQPCMIIYITLLVEILGRVKSVSYTHLRAHETSLHLVCRLLLEKMMRR